MSHYVTYENLLDLMPRLAAKVGGGGVNAVTDVLYKHDGATAQNTGDVLQLTHPYTDYDFIVTTLGNVSAGNVFAGATSVINPNLSNSILVSYTSNGNDNYAQGGLQFNNTTATISFITRGSSVYAQPTKFVLIEGIKFCNPNVYSTTEQRIGTWIDGKPVYQITLTGATPTTANTETVVADLSTLNMNQPIEIIGGVYNPNTGSGVNLFPISMSNNETGTTTNRGVYAWITSDHSLTMITGVTTTNRKFIFTIKYTK